MLSEASFVSITGMTIVSEIRHLDIALDGHAPAQGALMTQTALADERVAGMGKTFVQLIGAADQRQEDPVGRQDPGPA